MGDTAAGDPVGVRALRRALARRASGSDDREHRPDTSAARSSRMPQGPLKQVGDFPIEIALHTDVIATITVSVLGEQ